MPFLRPVVRCPEPLSDGPVGVDARLQDRKQVYPTRYLDGGPYYKEDCVYLDWYDMEGLIEDSVRFSGTIDHRIIKFPKQWEDIEFERTYLALHPIDVDLENILAERI